MPTPQYRVTASEPIAVGNITRMPGEIFSFSGWPKERRLEPANESAEKLYAYLTCHRRDPWLPASPKNDLAGGEYYLPATTELGASLRVVDNAPEHAPKYRVRNDTRFGPRDLAKGDEVVVYGWPTYEIEPINESARKIAEYFQANRDHKALLPSPWCHYRQDIVLPELPGSRKIFKRSEFPGGVAPEGGEFDDDRAPPRETQPMQTRTKKSRRRDA